AVGDDVGRGADAALAGLGSCADERAGNTGDDPRTIPRDRGALLANGCGEAMDDGRDRQSPGIRAGGIGAAGTSVSSDLRSDFNDRGSGEGICEMALLAGV